MCDPTRQCCISEVTNPLAPWETPNEAPLCPLHPPAPDSRYTPTSQSPNAGNTGTEAASPLSPAQAFFFGGIPVSSEDSGPPPVLPPWIIEQLLRPYPTVDTRDNQPPPPPPQTVITINDRDGLLTVSNRYDATVQQGLDAIANLEARLASLSAVEDPHELARELENLTVLLDQLREAADMVQDVHTRGGLNEYETINRWVNLLWQIKRAAEAAGASENQCTSVQVDGATVGIEGGRIRLQGVMLGFNLANINKHDPTYRTGTAVKLLIEKTAREVAAEWGMGRVLGIWGTNVVVEGIPEDRAVEFHDAVRGRVLASLRTNQALPPEISGALGATGLRTSDLAARNWLLRNPANLGLTAGHRSLEIDSSEVRPGGTELRVIEAIEGMSEAEMEARRLGKTLHRGPPDPESPVIGKGSRPLLRTGPVISDLPPHLATPVEAPDSSRAPLTPELLEGGGLPNPAREARGPVWHCDRLTTLLSLATQRAYGGDLFGAQATLEDVSRFLTTPQAGSGKSVSESLSETYHASLEQLRFPGVFRLEMFPQLATRTFHGERFFIQMAEYRDYWGHNQAHPPNPGDSLHRLTVDLLVQGYEYHGLDVLVGTQGGDEVFFAVRGKTQDGRELTDADVARISDYLGTHFNRVFENVTHHETAKVPPLPGGRYAGRNYAIQDGRLYVERGAYRPEQIPDLLETIRIAYGQEIPQGNVVEVESLSKVAQVERWQAWMRVDAETGRVIEVFRPIGEAPPEGFVPKEVPLSTTISPAVEVPANSPPEVTRLAMDRAATEADQMKKEGVATATEERPPVIRLSVLERLDATRGGRFFLNAGMFGIADVASEGLLQLFTGESRIASADFYTQMATSYLTLATGTYVGEMGARAVGLKGVGVKGGGILGAILLTELIHSGRIDVKETGVQLGSMGIAALTTRGLLRGGTALLESTGVLSASSRAAFLRHPATAVALVVGEFLILKGIGRWRANSAREEAEGELRGQLGQAIWDLDQGIVSTQIVGEDGSVNQNGVETLRQGVQRVTEAFGDLMMFGFLHQTEQGREFLEAQAELHELAGRLSEALEDLAEDDPQIAAIRSTLGRNPVQAWQELETLLRSDQRRDLGIRLHVDLKMGMFWQTDLSRAVRDFTESESAFNTMVHNRLATAPSTTDPVPLNKSPGEFATLVREDPVRLYHQFQSYLESRIALADQVAARHYAMVPYPQKLL